MGTETMPSNQEADKVGNLTELDKKIIRQIEYYFGNFNLSRDKFLREQIKIDDGWVPLETLIKFNRLKSLSEDFAVIAEALKKSPKELMEVNEDCTKIRRRSEKPVPGSIMANKDEIDGRTLYMKGFKKNATLDELLDFFKEYKTEHVYMRKNVHGNNRVFKGSVFVIFETKEDSEKFLATEGIKYDSIELLKERKKDYIKRKDTYFENIRAEKAKKMLKRAAEKQGDKDKDINVSNIDMVSGCLLKVSDLNEKCTREQIKAAFDPHGIVVYTDYSMGNPIGVVRFETGIAASVLEKLPEEDGKKKIEIGSSKAIVSSIEGEEEEEYWKNIAVSRANSRLKNKNQRFYGNRGRFKKNWGRRQRGRDNRDDGAAEESVEQKAETNGPGAEEPATKKQKTSSDGPRAEEPATKKQKTSSDERKAEEPKAKRQNTESSEGNTEEPSSKRQKTESSENTKKFQGNED